MGIPMQAKELLGCPHHLAWLGLERPTRGEGTEGGAGDRWASTMTTQRAHVIRTAHLLEKPWPPRGGMKLIPPGTLCQAPSSGHLPSHALRSVRGESPSPLFLLPSMLSFTASQKRERRGLRTTMPPQQHHQTCLLPFTRAEKGMSPQQLRLATRSRSAGHPSMRSKSTWVGGCQP